MTTSGSPLRDKMCTFADEVVLVLFELIGITANITLENQAFRTRLPVTLNDLIQDPQDERRLLASRNRG
jgi:hypothetical protein